METPSLPALPKTFHSTEDCRDCRHCARLFLRAQIWAFIFSKTYHLTRLSRHYYYRSAYSTVQYMRALPRFGYPWHESFVYAWARTALFPDRSPPRLSKHLTHFFLSPGHTSYELEQCRVMILSGTYLFFPSNLFDAKILCNNFESRRRVFGNVFNLAT